MIKSFEKQWAFLSNFHWVEVVYEGVTYPSVEHAYQAAKFIPEKRSDFLTGSAAHAKKMGRRPGKRDDWEEVKVGIMEDLVRQKFQRPDLREKLDATGDMHIEEGNYWNDTFWGVCRGKGRNELGKILMRVRG